MHNSIYGQMSRYNLMLFWSIRVPYKWDPSFARLVSGRINAWAHAGRAIASRVEARCLRCSQHKHPPPGSSCPRCLLSSTIISPNGVFLLLTVNPQDMPDSEMCCEVSLPYVTCYHRLTVLRSDEMTYYGQWNIWRASFLSPPKMNVRLLEKG